jgi:hypothetical protein
MRWARGTSSIRRKSRQEEATVGSVEEVVWGSCWVRDIFAGLFLVLVRFVGWVLRCGFGGSSRSVWYRMVQVRLCGPQLHVQGFMFYLLVREVLRSRSVVCVSTCMCLQGVVVNNVAAIDVTFSMASTLSDPSGAGAGAGARSLPKGTLEDLSRFVDYNSTFLRS